jgi:hypothetical protein
MENEPKSRWPIWGDTKWYASIEAPGLTHERRILLEHLLTLGNRISAGRACGMTREQVRTVLDNDRNFRGAIREAQKLVVAGRDGGKPVDCAGAVILFLKVR